jgi:hypothetical protein
MEVLAKHGVHSAVMLHLPAWALKFIPNPIKYWLDRRTRIIEAGNAFRATVLSELQGLYPIPNNWPKGTGIEPLLKGKFAALQTAVETYKQFLSKEKQAAFDEAWVTYFCALKGRRDQTYHHYMNITSTLVNSFGGETVIPNDGKATFKRNVDRLLSFAQDK